MKDIFTALNVNESSIKEDSLPLKDIEKIFYHLNKQDHYFFRIPTVMDLKTILRSCKDELCITKLAECVETVVGHVNKVRTIQKIPEATFNTHEFYHQINLGTNYILDLVGFPKKLEEKEITLAVNEFEKFLYTNDLIKQKKVILDRMGFRYFIHYDADKIINHVLLDEK